MAMRAAFAKVVGTFRRAERMATDDFVVGEEINEDVDRLKKSSVRLRMQLSGLALAGYLYDRYHAYRQAEKHAIIQEITRNDILQLKAKMHFFRVTQEAQEVKLKGCQDLITLVKERQDVFRRMYETLLVAEYKKLVGNPAFYVIFSAEKKDDENEESKSKLEEKGITRDYCEANIAMIKQKIESGSDSPIDREELKKYERWLGIIRG